ncbi:MAG: alanine--tRNA ligase [archaeon]
MAIIPDKQVKSNFRKIAWKNPEKYYAVSVLKKEGFERRICFKCQTPFWSVDSKRKTCDDPACSGGFRFIGQSPVKKEMDYIQVWKTFSNFFKKRGYTPIKRYPVVARWRSDTDFVQASIYDFQPYVVSGEVEPPANPLVVPQFCVRFNDIDNVGFTGSHFTGFVMIGQHAFVPPKDWNQKKYFLDIHEWLTKGLGLPPKEITYHEDAWAGGGNFGPSMEFFSRGLELGNQVYMMFEQTPKGNKELNLKVLDMGMGHERNAWFAKGTSTSYEATFPTVVEKLYKQTSMKVDKKMVNAFLPYASYLNLDEMSGSVDKVWKNISKQTGYDVKKLRTHITDLAALYSVADHSRSLLFTLNDGALPSNVGGGYNLRVILRRALAFIDKYEWDVSLNELCHVHAKYLKPLFPELKNNLKEIEKILDVERVKYNNTKQKTKQIVANLKGDITENKLLELYDSQGIAPELIKEHDPKLKIPDDFYAKVAERHEKKEQVAATVKEQKLDLKNVDDTKALYFSDYSKLKFEAKVIQILENKYVVLDQTYFYPTSGGQLHDVGEINGDEVVDVFKQGNVIVHVVSSKPNFKKGDTVDAKIERGRRMQLAQHHTAAHILNSAAKKVLGNHVNQAGAKKTESKAHLDITHYQSISEKELEQIEIEANRIISESYEVKCKFYPRTEAEKKFGMAIYQGGAVPGKELRIVEIPTVDVECCGGTHLKNTCNVKQIKILKSNKVQDGIIRLTFVAGNAALAQDSKVKDLLNETAELLNVKKEQLPARANELFCKWKLVKKAKKGKKITCKDLDLTSNQIEKLSDEELLKKTAEVYNTQIEHVLSTTKRFIKDIEEVKKKL